jgi:TM2 domain-containing membrane protein YozV
MENTTNGPTTPAVVKKEPLLAAIGSFFFPGLGQVYNGEGMVKGLMYLIGTLIGYVIFILPGIAIWLYGIYNAYKVADKMKSGTIPAKGTTTANLLIFIVLSVIIYIVYFVVIFIIFMAIAVLIFGISSNSISSY